MESDMNNETILSKIQEENRGLKMQVKDLESELRKLRSKITVRKYRSIKNLDGTTTLEFDGIIEHVGYSEEQCGREK